MSKNVSDLNMKLKMQIGDYRLENEKLLKDNDQMNAKANSWEHQLQAANRSIRENEDLVREKVQQIESLTEEAMQMKTQILTFQEDAKSRMSSDSDLKKENVKFKVDQAAALNKITKYQKDFEKVESDRKEGLHKIQALNIEMKQMRMKLEEFEANKAADVKRLEASLTESLKSNKKVADNLNQEKEIIAQMENHKESLEEEIEKLKIENRNIQSECKKHASTIENKKKLENELESMVSDLKDKVEKYEDEKKAIAKAERMRKTSVASQKNEEKKEWEEKLEKAKIQFDRASVEGKKNMARLEEENNKATAFIEDVKTQLEKKEVECRGLNTKLGSMDKEFKRYKTWAQEKSETYEKTIEDMEGRVSEGRRNMEQWKRKHDNIVNDLESANKFKDSLNETIQTLNAEIENIREQNSGNISLIELEKDKVEEQVKEKDQSIKELQNEKAALQRKSEQQVKDLNNRIGSLKDEVNKSSDEKDELMKRFENLNTEKDKSADEKINIKNNEIKAKERELVDFKQVAEIKEKKLLGDIEREKEDKSKIQTTLKAEIDELKSDVSKKQGDITKLEKEKRDQTQS
jgi:chromosome segregation ATPase